ncbi:MAG: hypothetical protein LW721_08240 [Flammeovirgaceae bacterium]|jgi:hypothetical protein|nr:hypothetical protein [Flammeovirgaceae bacterium]
MKIMKMMAVALLGSVLSVQAQDSLLARVAKIQGKEVYILNQPLRQYETVATIKTSPKIISLLTRGVVNETISDKANQFVRKSARKAQKLNTSFDAIIYSGGKTVRAIRFTDVANPENSGVATVTKIWGVDSYILAEPMKSYAVQNSTYGGIKLIPFITYGIVNNSIEKDVMTFAKKTKKEDVRATAMVYSTGRNVAGISLK